MRTTAEKEVSAIDRPTMERLTEEGPWRLEEYTVNAEDAEVHFLGPDVAIVAYRVDERVVVDGETLPIEANDSSVWVRRNGEWRCALGGRRPRARRAGRRRSP